MIFLISFVNKFLTQWRKPSLLLLRKCSKTYKISRTWIMKLVVPAYSYKIQKATTLQS